MKPLSRHVLRDHVLIGGLSAIVLLPFLGGLGSLAFWIATVLIDLDHYLRFLYFTRFKVIGINHIFRFYEHVFADRNDREFLSIDIFHTIEFLLLVGAIGIWVIPIILPIFWGFIFHMLVDFVHLWRFKMLTKRCCSFVEYWWRRKRMLSKGKDPDYIFYSASKVFDSPTS